MTDATRRTIRTTIWTVAAVAAALPLLIHTAGLPDALPGIGTVIGVSAAITRLAALPTVDQLLPAWLRKEAARAALPPLDSPEAR
ncbi:hypothetical protein [Kitasatospora sp. MBT63]|uniref:hypothetical protein n=1 Tax=Kitasatospora sp. MBT63 TaxID=1444768 RepID=UPI00053B012A|nr:hypothetical protein [Kitasatospora sp. MBT63]